MWLVKSKDSDYQSIRKQRKSQIRISKRKREKSEYKCNGSVSAEIHKSGSRRMRNGYI
jgi:hypothetical protein